jgi:hypothetical protein
MPSVASDRRGIRVPFGRRWPIILVASAMLAPVVATGSGQARADTLCPAINFLGDYPQDEELNWSENIQGVAHDRAHWFFTNSGHLMKIPVGHDLSDGVGVDETNPDWAHPTADLRRVGIPDSLADLGYNHYGDIDQIEGFVLAPLEKDGGSAFAAFRASDLRLVSWMETTGIQGEKNGWLAISPVTSDPARRLIYSSGENVSAEEPMTRYTLNLGVLKSLEGDETDGMNDLDQAIAFKDHFYLHEADGGDLEREFRVMQGATFTPWGDMFTINGYLDEPFPLDFRGGIHLFDAEGTLVTESENGSGDFNFEYHVDDDEEPEGIDWWNRAGQSPSSPHIGGQLHAVMIDNTNFDITDPFDPESDPDDLYFKHYTVDYFCRAGLDSDGDGLTDDAEVYQLNTDPLVADTDGDGLSDGDEVNTFGSDPLDPDTDGDGITDGDEIDVYGSDPTKADTDGDGLTDGDEINTHGTSPILSDTDGDGLSDPDELFTYGTDPTKADTEGDGVTDGDEVTLGTDPNDPDGDDDGLDDGLEMAYGTDPGSADTDGDGLLDGQDVDFVQNAVGALPISEFRPPGQGTRKAILKTLDDVERRLLAGDENGAIKLLRQLRVHLDGCGTAPDGNDWIVDCPDQTQVRALVDLLIANIVA